MASGLIEIYNRALTAIGESLLVEGTEDDSLSLEVCRLHYPGCLRTLLQYTNWPWATRQSSLNEAVDTYDSTTTYAASALVRYDGWVFSSVAGSNLGNTPSLDSSTYWTAQYPSAIGWGFVYSVPTDCVRPIALLLEGERVGTRVPETKYPYEIQMDNSGISRVLCCDLDPDDTPILEYVAMPQTGPYLEGGSIEDSDYPLMYPPMFTEALVYFLASKIAVPLTKNNGLAVQCYQMHKAALSEAMAIEFNLQQKDLDPSPSSVRVRE